MRDFKRSNDEKIGYKIDLCTCLMLLVVNKRFNALLSSDKVAKHPFLKSKSYNFYALNFQASS